VAVQTLRKVSRYNDARNLSVTPDSRDGRLRAPLILCYHAVSSAWPSALAIAEEVLEHHVQFLRERAYQALTLSDAERRRHERTLAKRSVVITFDDAFASTLAAKPILDSAGFPATVFVPTGFIDSDRLLSYAEVADVDARYAQELRALTWEELAELRDSGWEIGSHTVSHPRLTELDDASLFHELEESRNEIRKRLGDCGSVAYPYGLADARVAAAARRAGYIAGCTLTASHRIDERFRRPRVGLYPPDTGLRFRAKLSPALRTLRRTALADFAQSIRLRTLGSPPS
jgi:peptidoglycan/xylan/chitin deacetylase (PgdA/CDA1 family)